MRARRGGRRIAASITCLLWGFFTYAGYTLTTGVAQRQVSRHPAAGQWHYYVYFPLIMLIGSIGLLFLARRLSVTQFVTIWSIQVVVVIPFLFLYGGGV